ncbi:MAG: glucosamine-6-phosphate deaminase [Paludibacter sp.]|nr:glucosamine-6-phosphate deaminase [Bacteroidales bacterium]MCM1069713.1 glucosamine-6-phosphate deaminase [Prevotella sp.]MCM1354379.1 glucosamine-6-phosphate deaminase [Bacteroides sp.]MCM1441926.1 glucosamine-6-phosphate deaminase [Muribaculum sp.]MCM1482577.1 glucosamine-6-phosphate deaminase [Paludibacter sp.]
MRTNLSSLITLNHVAKKLYQPDDVFELSRVTRMELVRTNIYKTAKEGAKAVAQQIAAIILDKQKRYEPAVLSFVAGRSTTDIFQELVHMHQEDGLSFRNVVIFNLFEYYPLAEKTQGCFGQLKEQLLDHIDIKPENIYTFDGTQDKAHILTSCYEYERKIQELGGIDFQLLGIGRGGNIGFNEPGTQFNSPTRLVILDNVSKNDAAGLFGSADQAPVSAITMGIGTILRSKQLVLVAWGEHKADMIKAAIEHKAETACPASALQQHNNAQVIIDLSAASKLTRISQPWLVTSCEWDDQLTRRAIVWLCQQTGKPILKLTNKDYNEYGLSELITLYGSAYNCNIKIFNDLQHTITGWPGGKPNADDTNRPERANPYPKKVLIFSPHPDDDVISMGGTFARLIKQGHDVHIAYETSGCIAVCDDEVVRFMDFMKGFSTLHEPENKVITQKYDEYTNFIFKEKIGDQDTREILDIKALIRRGEATAACRHMGLPTSHIHFLNLPFYETGTIKKGDLSQKDIDIVKKLLLEQKPDEMFVAGDLADPHGTHKVCLDAVLAAIDELKDTEKWLHDCRIWMYRGAWMEWEVDLIEMAVPMSPEELRFKRNTILKHQSQMESAPFMGNDERLFWQRAEDRNHATAELYAQLGLANYEAIEAFVQYHIL